MQSRIKIKSHCKFIQTRYIPGGPGGQRGGSGGRGGGFGGQRGGSGGQTGSGDPTEELQGLQLLYYKSIRHLNY